MLRGTTTYLTSLELANAETIRAWVNDAETNRWMMSGHIPVSAEEERAFIAMAEGDRAAGTAYRFEIHAADDARLLGVCGIEHVSQLHRHGELGIFIGPTEERGKGFGADALTALMRFAFDTLGLHSLRICVFSGNERAHELYARLGFRETGVDRQSHYFRGAFRDLVRLDMLEDEYRELYPSQR